MIKFVTLTFRIKVLLLVSTEAAVIATSANDCYTKFPSGQTPYENDGGCYFCAKFPDSTFPISNLDDLADNCMQMCDSDPKCTAFTIARQASLHAHEYYWGSSANCCLEREEYPQETFINAHNGGDEPNTCEKEIMCWTRYEANTAAATASCSNEDKRQEKSELCAKVWKAREFTEEKKKQHIDFVKGGCNYKDETFESMLSEAYDQCKAEIEAEQQNSSFNTDRQRSAWIAHGVIGVIAYGILVPVSAFTPFFPGLIPAESYMAIHIATFALTMITVLLGLKTMKNLGNVGESHRKEAHHVIGLLLLLLVSLQALVSIHRGEERKLITVAGLFAFCFGVYQVQSGLGLFSLTYETINWSQVYLGYILWLMLMVAGVRIWTKYQGKTREYTQIQMRSFQ